MQKNYEKELQNFFEKNLERILGLKFIETEFSVGNFRVDTLGYDDETNSFKIIEYKNIKNHSLVDQGYTYLKLMLERKADFVLKYNEKLNSNKKITDIDWSQSRIVFVSPIYTEYQLNATDFKNISIDLIKVTKYEQNIVEIDMIKKSSNIKIEDFNFDTSHKEIEKEIKVYTEEDHTHKLSNEMLELYQKLKEKILELDDIDVIAKKYYIAFKGRTNIIDIVIKKNSIEFNINMKKGTLDDPLKLARDISNVGHWGNGDYRVDIYSEDDIDKIMPLIKQSLKINKK